MATTSYPLTTAWTAVATASGCVVQRTSGDNVCVHVGASEPAASATGFHVLDAKNNSFSYGGSDNVYVRATFDAAVVAVTAE
jgi:hypothetical protein